jgi:hypothetical protein
LEGDQRRQAGNLIVGLDEAANLFARNSKDELNDTLRQYIAKAEEPLEATLRRVIREEIRRAS